MILFQKLIFLTITILFKINKMSTIQFDHSKTSKLESSFISRINNENHRVIFAKSILDASKEKKQMQKYGVRVKTTIPLRNRSNSNSLSFSKFPENKWTPPVFGTSKSPNISKYNKTSKSNRRKTKDMFFKKKIQLSRVENWYSTNVTNNYPKALIQAGKEKILSVQTEEYRMITNLNKILMSSKKRMREIKTRKENITNHDCSSAIQSYPARLDK